MREEYIPETRKEAKEKKSKVYKTNRPCVKGHYSDRLTSSGQCRECLSNRSKILWSDPEYRNRIKEELKKYIDKDKNKKYSKEYNSREVNKERRRELNKKYHAIYMESEEFRKRKARITREWKSNNPEKLKAALRARRNSLRASGKVSSASILKLLYLQQHKCANLMCKKTIDPSKKNSYHVDHIIPVSKGGSNEESNIQILCPKCNLTKGAKDPIDWARENGLLI